MLRMRKGPSGMTGKDECRPEMDANRASGLRATMVGLLPIATAAEMTLFGNESCLTLRFFKRATGEIIIANGGDSDDAISAHGGDGTVSGGNGADWLQGDSSAGVRWDWICRRQMMKSEKKNSTPVRMALT